MKFDIVTLFPEIFPGYLRQSLLHKAIEQSIVQVNLHNLRDWAPGKQKQVDDRPFGGGPGMVLMPQPVVHCVEELRKQDETPDHLILLSPQGRKLNQALAEELASFPRLILLCGRYEGFDERIVELLSPDEVSIGDYVLSGGEVAAMVVVDTVVRLVPGVLGDRESSQQDSFSSAGDGGRPLEFAQYTRPRVFRGLAVPEVLLSGNHPEIARWRDQNSRQRTQDRRADLLPGSEEQDPLCQLPPTDH